MGKGLREGHGQAAALAAIAAILAAALGTTATAKSPPKATGAATISATDTGKLHYNRRKSEGSLLVEEGPAKGSLPGWIEARLHTGATFGGSFVFHTHNSTITGRGTATPRVAGKWETFAGSMTITGGTGRYRHAHGKAGLYGAFNRLNYEVTVQTTGKIAD